MNAAQAMAWLDARIEEGRGAITLCCEEGDGRPAVFMGDSNRAAGVGDTVPEAVEDAARNWKGWDGALDAAPPTKDTK